MAPPQDEVSATVNQMDIEINSISSDSDSDTPTGTSTTSPAPDRATDHPMADSVVDASSAGTDPTSHESGAAKRTVEDPTAEAGPATKRQKSSSGSDAFPTVKAKQEERSRRKKLMLDQVEAELNEWKQANEGLTKKKKLDHKKEVMKRVSDEFMARDEHPDQIVVEKSSAKPKDTSTPTKNKVASVVPAPQASPAVADERAAQSTSSTPQVDAAPQPNVRKPEKAIAAANPDGDAKAQTPKKSGTKAAKQQAQPATPKDRKKQPSSKKPDSSKKNSAPENNNDGKVLIDGTADFVSNNLVEKAQSDALETILKANEKATEIRKEAEEQAAQVIANAHAQVDEKVKNAGEEAVQIVQDAEGQVAQILAEARQRAKADLDKAREDAEAIDRDSQLRVGEVVGGARGRAVRADEEAANALRDIDTATEEIRRGKTTLKDFFEGIAARAAPTQQQSQAVKQQGSMEHQSRHASYPRGYVDFPHHHMPPPARAASVPTYENKVFKLKQEEAEN